MKQLLSWQSFYFWILCKPTLHSLLINLNLLQWHLSIFLWTFPAALLYSMQAVRKHSWIYLHVPLMVRDIISSLCFHSLVVKRLMQNTSIKFAYLIRCLKISHYFFWGVGREVLAPKVLYKPVDTTFIKQHREGFLNHSSSGADWLLSAHHLV